MPWKARVILICGILRVQRQTRLGETRKCEYQSAQIQVMNFSDSEGNDSDNDGDCKTNKRLQVAYTHAHAYMWPPVPQGSQ